MRTHSKNLSDTIVNILIYIFFIAFTLICIFPFYYLFINTISNNDLSSKGLINFIPRGIHFTNYLQVLKIRGLGQAAFITLSRTVIGTALTVFASAFLGFLFTKKEMWGRKFWYRFVIITMYFNAGIMPWYITMMNLKLTNNFLAYVLPSIISPFNIILVKTFIEGIPESLQEAAEIDGAGLYTIFLKIIMPLIKPILATITIFSAVGQWNSFTDTLFLVTDSKLFTLQFVLYKYLNEASSLAALIKNSQSGIAAANIANMQTATSVRMTVSMIVVIPILFVYPYFQRHFVKGVMIGAVKG
ncbi:carbohydrate ABC transporter permease [Clostridium folliculivorans]|uniref:Sugar ABC transporter permease n=1 Tax=Clostridium folliculivorans TaxID=2886038 RepID=A0A9W5Y0K1_9CLOT|nr:carbohydrate ABC transporter permease [Clostridium folliculivorans]GKU24519.1 sugar ABC transporter permease [Clostridium folliculivorans]GKU30617.1 sugar ABC transporter permease [Clostridium folliculivorans]